MNKTATPSKTLEELRDDLCKSAPNEEYITGILDMYNAAKKFITYNLKSMFEKEQTPI